MMHRAITEEDLALAFYLGWEASEEGFNGDFPGKELLNEKAKAELQALCTKMLENFRKGEYDA